MCSIFICFENNLEYRKTHKKGLQQKGRVAHASGRHTSEDWRRFMDDSWFMVASVNYLCRFEEVSLLLLDVFSNFQVKGSNIFESLTNSNGTHVWQFNRKQLLFICSFELLFILEKWFHLKLHGAIVIKSSCHVDNASSFTTTTTSDANRAQIGLFRCVSQIAFSRSCLLPFFFIFFSLCSWATQTYKSGE